MSVYPPQGTQPFGTLDIITRPPVLIPRHETEEWTIKLSKIIAPSSSKPVSVLDLGTGTGCIPLLLCHLSPPGSVSAHGVDISPHAIRLAAENARRSGIPSTKTSSQNSFTPIHADYTSPEFFSQIKLPYDLITSNPPYIPRNDYEALPPSVRSYEDKNALDGGVDGLDFYRAIAHLLRNPTVLSSNALVALEIGHDQSTSVCEILQKIPRVCHLETWKDAWGKDRTILARTV